MSIGRRVLRWGAAAVVLVVAAELLPLGLALAGEDVCLSAGPGLHAGPQVELLLPRYVCTRAVVQMVRGQPLVVGTGEVTYTERPWDLAIEWAIVFVAALALASYLVLPTLRRRDRGPAGTPRDGPAGRAGVPRPPPDALRRRVPDGEGPCRTSALPHPRPRVWWPASRLPRPPDVPDPSRRLEAR